MKAEMRNLTVSVPKSLVRDAKVEAAKRDESLNRFVREAIEEKLRRSSSYEESKKRHLQILEGGFDMGSLGRLPPREELHERD